MRLSGANDLNLLQQEFEPKRPPSTFSLIVNLLEQEFKSICRKTV